MGDFGVIGDVSATLVKALNDGLVGVVAGARAELNDLAGTAPAGLALTVTLYEILEDAPSRNRSVLREPVGGAVLSRKPPMALRLRYLVTPHGGDVLSVQQMVGRAMQILYDDAVLDGLQLLGSLRGSQDTLKITLAPLTLEERTRVWYALQKPYRLSLNYEVRVVNLDALQQESREVVRSRTVDVAAPEVMP